MIDEKEIPSGWEVVKLGDVCFTTSGGTPSRSQPNFYNGTIPWIKSGELDKGLILDSEEKITEDAIKNSSAKIFPKGTLLIALYGATIGKLAFLGVDAATNQAVCGIYKNEIINSKYLFQFLFFSKQNLVKQSIGGAQPNISQGILKNLEIPLPPFKEQERILAKLEDLFSDLDKGIESLEKAQQQLKVYRQAVLKWAFEGKFTNKTLNGELPKGWKLKAHNEIAFINPKLPFEKIDDELDVSFLPMKFVEEEKNKIHLTEFRKYKVAKKGFTPFTNGDIIFAKITPCMENGKIAILHDLKNQIGFGSTEFHVSRPKENINPKFIFYFIIQETFRRNCAKHFTGSVGQKRVPTAYFSDYKIPVPPTEEEQEKIIQEIESRLSVCDKIEETITESLLQAEALRLSIIKKAFQGKLVRQNPKDESATKLLERIRAEKMSELGVVGFKDERINKKMKS